MEEEPSEDTFTCVGARFVEYWLAKDKSARVDETEATRLRARVAEAAAAIATITMQLAATGGGGVNSSHGGGKGTNTSIKSDEAMLKELSDAEDALALAKNALSELYREQARRLLAHVPVVEVAIKVTEISECVWPCTRVAVRPLRAPAASCSWDGSRPRTRASNDGFIDKLPSCPVCVCV